MTSDQTSALAKLLLGASVMVVSVWAVSTYLDVARMHRAEFILNAHSSSFSDDGLLGEYVSAARANVLRDIRFEQPIRQTVAFFEKPGRADLKSDLRANWAFDQLEPARVEKGEIEALQEVVWLDARERLREALKKSTNDIVARLDCAESGLSNFYGIRSAAEVENGNRCSYDATLEQRIDRQMRANFVQLHEIADAQAAVCQKLVPITPLTDQTCFEREHGSAEQALKAALADRPFSARRFMFYDMNPEKTYEFATQGLVVSFFAKQQRRVNVCDSAPFDGIIAVYTDGPNDVVEPPVVRRVAAGECLDVAVQHGLVEGQRRWQDVFIGFVPVANSASFIAAMRESSRSATLWDQGRSSFHPSGTQLRGCISNKNRLSIVRGNAGSCSGTPIRLGKLKGPAPEINDTPSGRGLERHTHLSWWEAHDPVITQRLEWGDLRPTQRSIQSAQLARALSARSGVRTSPIILGVYPCENDDPLRQGVSICGHVSPMPHGYAAPAGSGEVIMSVAGQPVYSVVDFHRILGALHSANRQQYSSAAIKIRVGVQGRGTRTAVPIWNANHFRSCPLEAPGWSAFFNSLLMGAPEAMDDNVYGQMLAAKQFCSEERFWGDIAGMFAGVSGTVVRGGARLLGRGAGRAASRWASRPWAQMLLQATDEAIYTINTAPPLQTEKERIASVTENVALGAGVGIITSRWTR